MDTSTPRGNIPMPSRCAEMDTSTPRGNIPMPSRCAEMDTSTPRGNIPMPSRCAEMDTSTPRGNFPMQTSGAEMDSSTPRGNFPMQTSGAEMDSSTPRGNFPMQTSRAKMDYRSPKEQQLSQDILHTNKPEDGGLSNPSLYGNYDVSLRHVNKGRKDDRREDGKEYSEELFSGASEHRKDKRQEDGVGHLKKHKSIDILHASKQDNEDTRQLEQDLLAELFENPDTSPYEKNTRKLNKDILEEPVAIGAAIQEQDFQTAMFESDFVEVQDQLATPDIFEESDRLSKERWFHEQFEIYKCGAVTGYNYDAARPLFGSEVIKTLEKIVTSTSFSYDKESFCDAQWKIYKAGHGY